ncbi:MAG TPA: hypothetical protein VF221_03630 [Chloroflexota bacterium]
MDTREARTRMYEIAGEGLAIVRRFVSGSRPTSSDRDDLRRLVLEARALLAEAGYPGETVWRGLQRANIGADTDFDSYDASYWQDVESDLEQGIETLSALVSTAAPRDTDFHIVS